MNVTATEVINASPEKIWGIITDTDRWADTISGIIAVEVLDRPESGVVGLKWRETRMMFGKEADETMWITAAESNRWYETRAESHGAIYTTRVSIDDKDGHSVLSMQFSSEPVSVMAKLMSVLGFMFKGTMQKMMQQDLSDIRKAVEGS